MKPPLIRAIRPDWIDCRGVLAGLALVMAAGGCASSKQSVLPQNLPSMKAIYEAHTDRLGAGAVGGAREKLAQRGRPVGAGEADLEGFVRTAADEIHNRFPVVPNPTLVMFVFPHLGPHGAPVPGYATAFPLYESVEYALPGEVAP